MSEAIRAGTNSAYKRCLSLLHTQKVTSSSPVASTIKSITYKNQMRKTGLVWISHRLVQAESRPLQTGGSTPHLRKQSVEQDRAGALLKAASALL